jgi:hypothetical protein
MMVAGQSRFKGTVYLLLIVTVLARLNGGRVIYAGNQAPRVGAMGDSNTDEYRTDKNIPGLNWVEQLVISRGFDFGTFSEISWGEPRRIGYEYNWASDGATATGSESYDLCSQWPGLAEQVAEGKVDIVFLAIGNNDFYRKAIDIALGSLAGDDLKAYINSISSRIEYALDVVSAAGDVQLVLGNVIDVGVGQQASASQLARLTDAVVRLNKKIQFIANERVIPVIDIFGLNNLSLQDSLEIGGVPINLKGNNDDPHYLYLSDGHWGTVAQGLFANMFVEAINRAYGFSIEPLSDQEILANAGIPEPNPGGESAYFDISKLVIDPNGPATADFNRDGIVDTVDICMLVNHWNTDEAAYDIGPFPYGDGIIDVQDLVEMAKYLFEEVLPIELVAYWKLDEIEGGIASNSINDNHGILHGEPLWQPQSGNKGGALEFDGIDDYIETNFVLNPENGAFSIFTWIKNGAPGQVIISQSDGTGTGETWLCADMSNGNLMTGLVPQKIGRYYPQPLISGSIISDGQWHHVGFVWDGSYRALYADGVEVAIDNAAQNPLKSADGGLHIGAGKNLAAESFFSGLIDDVRIYDKALSTEEIAALAQ